MQGSESLGGGAGSERTPLAGRIEVLLRIFLN